MIQKTYPDIYSRLQISQHTKVIPSIEQLNPQMVSESQQPIYIPPSEIINTSALWNEGVDGKNVKIAIIDSGIDGDPPHGDFEGRIVYEESFIKAKYGYSSESEEDTQDYHGHGTHVAGIAAGGGSTYRGVAYNADLVNLKAADMSGHSTQEAMLAAIDEAIDQSVDIISISIGFGQSSPWGSGDELTLAVDSAVDAGISVVIAAGNEGSDDELASIGSPASARKAITVGATNGSYNIASFSSRGPSFNFKVDPDVVAPGVQIIAPLAPGCLIELAYESLVNVELEDYMILSGTSMATPVVSGAVALLKQQYPQATPLAIRAALQESAVDMNESLYTQGSGLVNVGRASELLKLSELSRGFNIISSLPRAENDKPIEFAERVAFPGDHARMGISFITGTGGTITWDISSSIEKFIAFNRSLHVQSTAGYFEKSLNITIPLNTAPGTYHGNISYTFHGTKNVIPLAFTLNNPNSKIYWDTHYTGKDDSPFFNYRALDGFLVSNLQFDMNEYESTLTWQNLSQNNILVLTDLEYPISEEELNSITKFHNQGGSILLVTSAFPYFNLDAYSRLSSDLGIPVNFTDRLDLVNYTDNGRNRNIIPLSPQEVEVNWEVGNPLFEGVNEIPLKMGTAFTSNQNDLSLKYQAWVMDQSYLVAAAFEPIDGKGKVLILGSEPWLYSSFLSTDDGQHFVSNIFNWLKPDNGLTVNSQISPSRQLEISAYYSNESILSVEISNGSSPLESSLIFNTTLQHHRLVVPLGEISNQRISVSIKNGQLTLKEFDFFDFSGLPEVKELQIDFSASSNVILPSWADEDSYDFVIDKGINFFLSHSTSSSVQSILLISNQLEDTLDVIIPPLDTLEEIVNETVLSIDSDTQQSLYWPVPVNFSTGHYSYEIQIWVEIGNFTVLLKTERGSFIIPDPEPTFNTKSMIKGQSIDYYRDIETSADIPSWNPGETIELRLIGQDTNSHEFTAHVQLIHYYLWFVDRTVLDYFEIPRSTLNKSENIGKFIVPNRPIPLSDDDYELEIDNQLYIFLIFIRDAQGNY
ncbi:MAG: S8 family serine peptidase, partial [Candidatus Heimdallarchaeota archaeon]